MKKLFRFISKGGIAWLVLFFAGCANRETAEALRASHELQVLKQYPEANEVLVQALRAREAQLRPTTPPPTAKANAEAVQSIQSDAEILKLERAQLPLYLAMQRADLASAVFNDILAGSANDPTVDGLLRDPDPIQRGGAARVLGFVARPASIPALVVATHDPDRDVRRAAVAALGQIKDPRSVPPLIEALKDSYWFVRSDAAGALALLHDGRAVGPLLNAVADPDASVQSSAQSGLVALVRAPNLKSDDFRARLNDPNPQISVIAAACLALLHDAKATPVLLRLAENKDAGVRLYAVKALGETGDPAVLPVVRQTLRDADINVRGWSILSLGHLKDRDSLPTLQALAIDPAQPPGIRAAASEAIHDIEGKPGT